MKPFPIQTERLLLREFQPEDEAAIHEYASDPEVTKYTSWGPNDLATTHAVLNAWLESQDKWPRECVPLAIELDGKLIGSTGFSSLDFDALTAVFGYVLHRNHWGKGYATEVVEALLEFGFESLALHRIVAECFGEHDPSKHVLEKAGMRLEGQLKKNARKANEWHDTCLYAILEKEWRMRRGYSADTHIEVAPSA